MPAVIDTFCSTYDFHRLPIKKGFGANRESLAEFLEHFRNDYSCQFVKFVDPGLVWQACQYDGQVCVGVFWVKTLTERGPVSKGVGIINTNVHHLEHAALAWLREHRQRNPDASGKWPQITAEPPYEHCTVSPVLIPEEGML